MHSRKYWELPSKLWELFRKSWEHPRKFYKYLRKFKEHFRNVWSFLGDFGNFPEFLKASQVGEIFHKVLNCPENFDIFPASSENIPRCAETSLYLVVTSGKVMGTFWNVPKFSRMFWGLSGNSKSFQEISESFQEVLETFLKDLRSFQEVKGPKSSWSLQEVLSTFDEVLRIFYESLRSFPAILGTSQRFMSLLWKLQELSKLFLTISLQSLGTSLKVMWASQESSKKLLRASNGAVSAGSVNSSVAETFQEVLGFS